MKIIKTPMIYINPDPAFMTFVRANNFKVYVNIKGTGMKYDTSIIPGVVNQSSIIPNCRPNFFNKNGYYIITLDCGWYGYPDPDRLGYVSIQGFTEPFVNTNSHLTNANIIIGDQEHDVDGNPIVKQSDNNTDAPVKSSDIIENTSPKNYLPLILGLIIGFGLIFIIIFIVLFHIDKKNR